jgi:hypothetical protein
VPSYAYVWFDLGSSKKIGTVRWEFGETGYADQVLIQVSNDKKTWTTVATVGNAPAGAWQSLAYGGSARYVRLYFNNPNRDPKLGAVAEVQLLA